MPKGVFVVQSSPLDAEHEQAFNDWYTGEHIPEVLAVPGFVGARRYRVTDPNADGHPYLTVYEIEADDVRAPLKEVFRRARDGQFSLPEHVRTAATPTTTLYELIGEYGPTAAGGGDQ